jgi:hypothetical protein
VTGFGLAENIAGMKVAGTGQGPIEAGMRAIGNRMLMDIGGEKVIGKFT